MTMVLNLNLIAISRSLEILINTNMVQISVRILGVKQMYVIYWLITGLGLLSLSLIII